LNPHEIESPDRRTEGRFRAAAVIAEVRAAGVATLIAKALTSRGVPTPSGRGAWSPATVMGLDRRVRAA
jgi:hypothetical protein